MKKRNIWDIETKLTGKLILFLDESDGCIVSWLSEFEARKKIAVAFLFIFLFLIFSYLFSFLSSY